MQFAEKVKKGVQCLVDGGHHDIAKWLLDKLLVDFPDNALLHYEKGMVNHHLGEVDSARQHFEKAVELTPDNPLFQKSLGDFIYTVEKDCDTALLHYQKVLSLMPNDLGTLLIVGHLHIASHRFDEASRNYQKVLKIAPGHLDAQQMMDRLSKRQAAAEPNERPAILHQDACRQTEAGHQMEATGILERLIALHPGYAVAYNDLGVLAFENGEKEKAQRLYEKACELDTSNGVFHKNLGDFYYLELGDPEKALSRYVQALNLNVQDIDCLIAIGHICMTLGRSEDARIFLNRVLEIEPWHDDAQRLLQQLEAVSAPGEETATADDAFTIAQDKAAAGDLSGAIQTLEQLVQREPHHARSYNDLGVLYYEQGDKDKALRFYEQAVRLAPHDDNFLKNLADFYFVEQGRTQDALRIYVQILKSNQQDLECLMAAGAICVALGKKDDASTFYERILQIDPWNVQARESLDSIHNAPLGNPGAYIAAIGRKRA